MNKTNCFQIMKGICCISVLEDYKRLRHYNIAELAKPEGESQEVKESGDAEGKVEVVESEENEDIKEDPISDDSKKAMEQDAHSDIPT